MSGEDMNGEEMSADAMHPFAAIMRRYCIDYTNVHDLSVCDEIMAPDYVVRSSGWELHYRDYKRTVGRVFEHFPTLGLTVHDLVTNGDRLVLRFSEHGMSLRHDRAIASWPGIALYTWDGTKLTSCAVEQDFLSRDRQLATRRTEPVEAPHPDPWAAQPAPVDSAGEALVARWLQDREARAQLQASGATVVFDDQAEPDMLVGSTTTIDDLFSAGDTVAFRFTERGAYQLGLPDLPDDAVGQPAELHATGLARVHDGRITAVCVIRDRWGLQRRLLGKG
jgi:hypothetical protein